MSNSPLVTYTKISPNKTELTNKVIDTITIHCVVGQCTAKSGCEYFMNPNILASSNYIVGKDGSIGLSVEEKDRAWTTGGSMYANGESGSWNDFHAITIEVASDTKSPYAVTEKAYAALIELVADICKRNNIKELLWKNDKTLVGQIDKQNITLHKWFANTCCPGEYLESHMSDIVEKVNAIIKPKTIYRVQVGAYSVKANAEAMAKKLNELGYATIIKSETI